MTVAALVLGAGMGERYLRRRRVLSGRGDRVDRGAQGSAGAAELPKALLPLAGKSLLRHALEALAGAPSITLLQPVLCARGLAAWPGTGGADAPGAELPGLCAPVPGGETRRASVILGLKALPAGVRWVAIHDAARPLLRSEDAERVVQEALRCGAAFLALPLHDTLHQVAGEQVVATAQREAHRLAQTPQVFRRDWLSEALQKADAFASARPARAGDTAAPETGAAAGGDEVGLLARFGYPVRPVAGDIGNLKITTPEDMQLAEALLRSRGQGA